MEQLAAYRRQGYALDNEEETMGVKCVAMAIRTSRGDVAGALSILRLHPVHPQREHPPVRRAPLPGLQRPVPLRPDDARHFVPESKHIVTPVQGEKRRIRPEHSAVSA
ncbi:MAG: IclR family transcriptional regulator C-terminal domain-containing protein [Lawsonibacter sp.]